MKVRLLIILAIVIVISISLSVFAIYDSSTVSFISCVPQYEQVNGRCILPTFKILLDDPIHPNVPLLISVEKTGYYMCDSWDARIIDLENNSTTWEKEHNSLCVSAVTSTQKRFQYTISNEINPIVISNLGNYTFQIEIGHAFLEKDFSVMEYEELVVYHDFDS